MTSTSSAAQVTEPAPMAALVWLSVTVTSTAGATDAPPEIARPAAAAVCRKSSEATTTTCWPALGDSPNADCSFTCALAPMVAVVVVLITLTEAAIATAALPAPARPME